MVRQAAIVEKRIHLSPKHADRLRQLAQAHQLGDDEVIAHALDVLFAATLAPRPTRVLRSSKAAPQERHELAVPVGTGPISEEAREALVKQRLIEAGLLTTLPQNRGVVPTGIPVKVRGRPLSEQIIEERR
jgi:hypothetical protein